MDAMSPGKLRGIVRCRFGLCLIAAAAVLAGCAHPSAWRRRPALPPPLAPAYAGLVAARFAPGLNAVALPGPAVADASAPRDEIGLAQAWLVRNQRSDGSWDSYAPEMTTSLALMALLTAREPSQAQTAAARKALDYLLAAQNGDGSWGRIRDVWGPLTHALALSAVADASSRHSGPPDSNVLHRAVGVILRNQQAGGGWAHGYGKLQFRSTLAGACQVYGLAAAWRAGLAHPGIAPALQRAAADLLAVQDRETGEFGRDFRGRSSWSATGEALIALQMMGLSRTREACQGLLAMQKLTDEWVPGTGRNYVKPELPLLETWLNCMAAYVQGGPLWQAWHARVNSEILTHQAADGSWEPPGDETIMGPAYATAICALLLQAPTHPGLAALARDCGGDPLAWRVTAPGAALTLACWVPAAPHDVYLLRDPFLSRLRACEVLFLPSDREEMARRAAELGHAARRNPAVSPDVIGRARKALDLPPGSGQVLERMPAWVIAAAVVQQALTRDNAGEDELAFFLRDHCRTPRVDYLLTSSEIVGVIEALSEEQEALLLEAVVARSGDLPAWRQALVEAWAAGRAGQAEALIEDVVAGMPELERSGREAVARLAGLATEQLTRALADGGEIAAFPEPWLMFGPGGVLARLREAGLKVEPLFAGAP